MQPNAMTLPRPAVRPPARLPQITRAAQAVVALAGPADPAEVVAEVAEVAAAVAEVAEVAVTTAAATSNHNVPINELRGGCHTRPSRFNIVTEAAQLRTITR